MTDKLQYWLKRDYGLAVGLAIVACLSLLVQPWLAAGFAVSAGVVAVYGYFKPATTHDSQVITVDPSNPDDAVAQLCEVLGFDVLAKIRGTADFVTADLEKTHDLVGDAMGKLNTSFMGLNQQTQVQEEMVQGLISKLSGVVQDVDAPDALKIEDFVTETEEVLTYYVNILIQVAKYGVQTVEKIDDMVAEMERIQQLVMDIKGIADQTNLLALNAAIEAARAGEAGRGFSVVADEVRKLSADSNRFSDQIDAQVKTMRSTVSDAKQIVEAMAATDMTTAINSKGRIEDMLVRLNALSESFSVELEKVGGISTNVNDAVNLAVQSMQVDDIVSQLLQQARRALNEQEELIGQVEPVLQQVAMSNLGVQEIQTKAMEIRTLAQRETRQSVPSGSLDEGEIELF